jgi:hypothetical protein
MTVTGTADYSIATVTYWSDDQLQTVLDNHRADVQFYPLTVTPWQMAGSVTYREYHSGLQDIEQGTVTYLQTSAGSSVGTSGYSVDYARGIVTFTANQVGTAYYITTRTYDLYGAAAEVWQNKAAQVAQRFDFSTDNHSIKASQLRAQYMAQANYYNGLKPIQSVTIYRGDT